MIGLMMAYANAQGSGLTTPLKEIGAFAYGVEALVLGPKAILAGALIQLGAAILIGIFFAQFVSRGTSTFAALCAGIAISIAMWLAMDLFVLPYQNPTMAARVALRLRRTLRRRGNLGIPPQELHRWPGANGNPL